MENIIVILQQDVSNALYFIAPLLISFVYLPLRKRTTTSTLGNIIVLIVLSICLSIMLTTFFLAIYAIIYRLGGFHGTSIETISSLVYFVILISVICANIDRQLLQNNISKNQINFSVDEKKNQTQEEMDSYIQKITSSARTQVLMLCGTMSFLERNGAQFSQLIAQNCSIKALCKKSTDPIILARYKKAKDIGIKMRYYFDDFDPGIRLRIIDPENNQNTSFVTITKREQDQSIFYWAKHFKGEEHVFEATLVKNLFRALWKLSDGNE